MICESPEKTDSSVESGGSMSFRSPFHPDQGRLASPPGVTSQEAIEASGAVAICNWIVSSAERLFFAKKKNF
jgi:hypothetical protein